MNCEYHDGNDDLTPTALVEINRICDRYEADLRAGRRSLIEDYLAQKDEPMRSALFKELLAIELECRRSVGEHPRVSEYRARFPTRGTIVEAAFAAGVDTGRIRCQDG